jgi:hypothetical protein
MSTVKEEAIRAIMTLPESATIDDVMYRLYVVEQIRKGIEEADRGEGISVAELEREIETW